LVFPMGFDTTGDETLSFAVRASQSGQIITINLYNQWNGKINNTVSLANYGGHPAAGQYKLYEIPLSALNGEDQIIKGIMITNATYTSQPVMYADDIQFLPEDTPPPSNPEVRELSF